MQPTGTVHVWAALFGEVNTKIGIPDGVGVRVFDGVTVRVAVIDGETVRVAVIDGETVRVAVIDGETVRDDD